MTKAQMQKKLEDAESLIVGLRNVIKYLRSALTEAEEIIHEIPYAIDPGRQARALQSLKMSIKKDQENEVARKKWLIEREEELITETMEMKRCSRDDAMYIIKTDRIKSYQYNLKCMTRKEQRKYENDHAVPFLKRTAPHSLKT